jgi:hypothetical protein
MSDPKKQPADAMRSACISLIYRAVDYARLTKFGVTRGGDGWEMLSAEQRDRMIDHARVELCEAAEYLLLQMTTIGEEEAYK